MKNNKSFFKIFFIVLSACASGAMFCMHENNGANENTNYDNHFDFLNDYVDELGEIKDQNTLNKELFWAVETNQYEEAELLLKQGADPDCRSSQNNKETALIRLARHSYFKIVHFEMMQLLVKYKADVNARELYSEETALCRLTSTGCYPSNETIKYNAIKFLVDNGAKINVITKSGFSPLLYAICSSSFEIVKFLIDNGADIHTPTRWSPCNEVVPHFPLWMAIVHRDSQAVQYLIENGIDITQQNEDKNTFLHGLLYWYRFDDRFFKSYEFYTKLLIGEGISLSVKNNKGDTVWALCQKRFGQLSLTKQQEHQSAYNAIQKIYDSAHQIEQLRKFPKILAYKIAEIDGVDCAYLIKKALIGMYKPEQLKIFSKALKKSVEGDTISLDMSVDECQKWLIQTYASLNIKYHMMTNRVLEITPEHINEQPSKIRRENLKNALMCNKMISFNDNFDTKLKYN